MKLYQELAQQLARHAALVKNENGWYSPEQAAKVKVDINNFVRNQFPCGSGFDMGTKLDWDASRENRIVLATEFHHMNEGGYYTHWTAHEVIITPDLAYGYNIRVTGRNDNAIKEYIIDVFGETIARDVEPGSVSPVRRQPQGSEIEEAAVASIKS